MRGLVITLMALALAACTDDDPRPRSPAGSPPEMSTTPPPSSELSTEPLVLTLPASASRPRLSLSRARKLVREPASRQGSPFAVRAASDLRPWMRTAIVAGIDPIRSPHRYPLQVPGPTPARPITVTVVGDLMLGRRVSDPIAAVASMGRQLADADLTLGNFESTLSTAGPATQGGDSFAADPAVVSALRRAGFDGVSLANNHAGDFGEQALLETVQRFERGPVSSFGAGPNLREASRPFLTTIRGVRFAVLGFNAIGETRRATTNSPGALSIRMPPRTGPLNRDDLRHVLGLVRRWDRRADVVLVLPHWGTQYTHVAEPSQRYVARRLVDAGADLVVGGHPHWVQGMEFYRDTVIAHSLGNFIFDMDFMTETMQGVMLEATFWGAELMAVDLVSYAMDEDFAPSPVYGALADDILGDVWRHSTGPFRSP